jgi:nicotinate-nucleotide adenylyltransferase
MKIGLIGGTFNPIHHGHLILSEYVRENFKLDKVIFIPTGLPPHKSASVVEKPEIRLEMTKLAIEMNQFFSVSDIETYREGISYTIDTIIELKNLYPTDQLYFLIGADSLFELPTWKYYEQLISKTNIIVVNRPGGANNLIGAKIKEYEDQFGGSIIEVKSPLIDISSSDIRNRVKDGKSIKYLVPNNVEEFILQNNLYKEGF